MTVIQQFFSAFAQGNTAALFALVDREAEFIAVRPHADPRLPLYGTYRGHDGLGALLTSLGAVLATREFEVIEAVGDGTTEFARGRFWHDVKATGRAFRSDWAVACTIRNGRILRYQFFEDSAALQEALAA